ncbi:hypothetical protein RBB50_012894 [Rhinocladiella similis]
MIMKQKRLHAHIVGAGFGGIYQLYKLREMGLSVKAIDTAGGVGDTWSWNHYPGAMSDAESYVYRYSWNKKELQNYPWVHHYAKQPDVLAYLDHVGEKHDLRKNIQFNTELLGADWDHEINLWRIDLSTGLVLMVRYLVTALGLLTKANYPDAAGINWFKGEMCHTAA